jgi:hypothetical protein
LRIAPIETQASPRTILAKLDISGSFGVDCSTARIGQAPLKR